MKNLTSTRVVEIIKQNGAVPVFYHSNWEVCEQIIRICYQSGFKVFEFTNRGANASELFKQLKSLISTEMPDMLLGAGTIFTLNDAETFINLDADFIVSPILNPEVGEYCKQNDILWIPGCMSTTEIFQAYSIHKAQIIKLFPGNILGASFLKSIRPVFPNANFMPTGGVSSDESNLRDWFDAGVSAVGMGSNLFPKELISAKEWDKIARLCEGAISSVSAIKNQK